MKTVIIGGSGFIGSRLAQRLVNRPDQEVVIADNRESSQFPNLWINTDVRDADQLRQAFEGADCVINLAAEHADDVAPVSLYYDVNVEGAKNICRIVDELGIRNVIFTSSVAVYAPSDSEIDESGDKSPLTDYGKSKLQAEAVFSDWGRSGKNLTIVRPTVVFGEGNRGNLFNLLDQIRRKRFLMVGSGANRKSLAYVENLADFLEESLYILSGVQIYNYVDKPDLSTASLVSILYEQIFGGRSSVKIPYFLGFAAGAFFDGLTSLSGRKFPISRARVRKFCTNTIFDNKGLRDLGFEPQLTLEEGLKRTVAFEIKATQPEKDG